MHRSVFLKVLLLSFALSFSGCAAFDDAPFQSSDLSQEGETPSSASNSGNSVSIFGTQIVTSKNLKVMVRTSPFLFPNSASNASSRAYDRLFESQTTNFQEARK